MSKMSVSKNMHVFTHDDRRTMTNQTVLTIIALPILSHQRCGLLFDDDH